MSQELLAICKEALEVLDELENHPDFAPNAQGYPGPVVALRQRMRRAIADVERQIAEARDARRKLARDHRSAAP